eukprot:scaffold200267_cov32-Tisochrysis_lutea.AAC.1
MTRLTAETTAAETGEERRQSSANESSCVTKLHAPFKNINCSVPLAGSGEDGRSRTTQRGSSMPIAQALERAACTACATAESIARKKPAKRKLTSVTDARATPETSSSSAASRVGEILSPSKITHMAAAKSGCRDLTTWANETALYRRDALYATKLVTRARAMGMTRGRCLRKSSGLPVER